MRSVASTGDRSVTAAAVWAGRLMGLALVALLGAACGTPLATPEPAVLQVAASTSVAPLAHAVAAGFHADYPHVEVRLEFAANSAAAEALVAAGRADLALALLPPTKTALGRLHATPVAQETLSVVVPAKRVLASLTADQVHRVFSGAVRDWADIGAGRGPIDIVVREPGSGARTAFDTAFLGGVAISPTALVMPDSRSMLDLVATTPGAIGYLPTALLDERVHPVAVDSAAGSSPALPVYLVRPEPASSLVSAFEEWALGLAGQAVVQERYAGPPAAAGALP